MRQNKALNIPDFEGNLPLHYAAQSGDVDTLTAILDAETKVISTGNYIQNTPAHIAASAGQLAALQSLFQKHCDINAVNSQGETPLFDMIRHGEEKEALSMLDQLCPSGSHA